MPLCLLIDFNQNKNYIYANTFYQKIAFKKHTVFKTNNRRNAKNNKLFIGARKFRMYCSGLSPVDLSVVKAFDGLADNLTSTPTTTTRRTNSTRHHTMQSHGVTSLTFTEQYRAILSCSIGLTRFA